MAGRLHADRVGGHPNGASNSSHRAVAAREGRASSSGCRTLLMQHSRSAASEQRLHSSPVCAAPIDSVNVLERMFHETVGADMILLRGELPGAAQDGRLRWRGEIGSSGAGLPHRKR